MSGGGASDPLVGMHSRDHRLLAVAGLAIAASLVVMRFEGPGLVTALEPFSVRRGGVAKIWDAASDLVRGPGLAALLLLGLSVARSAARRQLLLTTALLGGLAVEALKQFVARPRPLGDDVALSWPSGHAMSAFGFAAALLVGMRLDARKALLLVAAALVAISRVFVLRHWPSDVLASLGVALAAVVVARRLPVFFERLAVPAWLLPLAAAVILASSLVAMVLDPWGLRGPRAWGIVLSVASFVFAGLADEPESIPVSTAP